MPKIDKYINDKETVSFNKSKNRRFKLTSNFFENISFVINDILPNGQINMFHSSKPCKK